MRLSNCLKRFILWYKAYRMRRCYGKRISKIMHLNNISSKAIEGENEFIRKWQTLSSNVNINYSDYPFMHLLYSQLLVCQRVCLQNTVCLICK